MGDVSMGDGSVVRHVEVVADVVQRESQGMRWQSLWRSQM